MQTQSQEIGTLIEALSKAQAKMEGALRDCNNPFFKSKYADLSSVWEAAKGPLTENGLAVVQSMEITESGLPCLATVLGHKSGQWIKSMIPLNPQKPNDPQSMGSAITYYRRYSLSAMVGICPEDDDGCYATDPVKAASYNAQKAITEPRGDKVQPLINPPSEDEIEELYNLVGGDEELGKRLCEFHQVRTLKELNRSKYDNAVKFVKNIAKREQKNG